jgi:hypothetical protein
VRQAGENGEMARAAVLYRTNSQSRLFEEAMRRYQLKYHVVGGFSFYERAEIKDLISYLKVIQNPDDSVSLLRVINTPVRGIGKTTIEMIERLALETGLSMWGAVGEAIGRQLLPARAVAALKSFRELIEDGRAMLAGTFVERVKETAGLASDEDAAELLHPVKPTPGLTGAPVRSAGTGEGARPHTGAASVGFGVGLSGRSSGEKFTRLPRCQWARARFSPIHFLLIRFSQTHFSPTHSSPTHSFPAR